MGLLLGRAQPGDQLSSLVVEEGAPLPPASGTPPHHALPLIDAAEPSAQCERVTMGLLQHGPSLA